jgi:predicted O-linked N-acetylglucosamine transferase (SPINDLY family)
VGYSLLNSVGLGELVAESVNDYVRIATELAHDAQRRRALRMGMRQRLRGSSLMDGNGLARALEALYRDACAGRRA